MAEQLPGHLGRQVDVETGWALVCNAVGQQGNPHTDPLCGKPATHHLRWEEATTENSFACDEHLDFSLSYDPFDVHTVENSACGMPGAHWVPREAWRSSFCTMLALDEDPHLAGVAALETSHA